jgi:hypothetical protein
MKVTTGFTAALLSSLLALPLIAAPKPGAKPATSKPAAAKPEAAPATAKPTPEQVWPASLARIAGKYRFIQVASPGGLWQRTLANGKLETQQVSMSQLPKGLREQLESAELQILDLQAPGEVEASMKKSPGTGGMIRHYTEEARGKLVMRGLPGIGMVQGDAGEYTGEVVFGLEHTSLSNPSVRGITYTRSKTEPTWGVATVDYAEFTAMKPPKKDQDGADPDFPVFNARILRSGLEIFAFIQWADPEGQRNGTQREIWGSVRLLREDENVVPPPPPMPGPGRI